MLRTDTKEIILIYEVPELERKLSREMEMFTS